MRESPSLLVTFRLSYCSSIVPYYAQNGAHFWHWSVYPADAAVNLRVILLCAMGFSTLISCDLLYSTIHEFLVLTTNQDTGLALLAFSSRVGCPELHPLGSPHRRLPSSPRLLHRRALVQQHSLRATQRTMVRLQLPPHRPHQHRLPAMGKRLLQPYIP